MNLYLKKSKIILLCIMPVFISLAVSSYIFVNSGNLFSYVSNSNSPIRTIGLFPGLILYLVMFSVYVYIGFIFLKQKSKFYYKLFAYINFLWFIFKFLYLFITLFNLNFHIYNIFVVLLDIFILIFQIIDMYLIITYNKHLKS